MNPKIEIHPNFIPLAAYTLLFTLAFWFQQHTFFNWDASWHLEGAKRMLHGGNYPNQIFDDNLPMVFWFFIPTVILHNTFHFNLITLANIQVDIFLFLTIMLCNRYLRQLYTNNIQILLISSAILLLLFFFPGEEFAQRDMLVTLFCLPYLFLIAATIETQKYKSEKPFLNTISGVWAAIGIAMNPFYGLIIIALEIQLICNNKKIRIFRPELMAFSANIFFYLGIIAVFYPQYYTTIIPAFLVFSSAYSVYDTSFMSLLQSKYPAMLIIETLLLYALLRQTLIIKGLPQSLLICVIVSYLIFLINGKDFTSHIIFLVITANLFFFITTFHSDKVAKNTIIRFGIFLLTIYCIVMSTLLAYSSNQINYNFFQNPKNFLNQMISFFQKTPKNTTYYVFSTSTQISFPLNDYTHLQYLPRWPNAWMTTIMEKNYRDNMSEWKYRWFSTYKTTFLNQIAEDVSQKKPDYIIVNISKHMWSTNNIFKDLPFNYISFFSQNSVFQKAWKNYQLKKTIGEYAIYQRKLS